MFSNAIFICQIMAIISDDQAPDIYIKHDYWDNSFPLNLNKKWEKDCNTVVQWTDKCV